MRDYHEVITTELDPEGLQDLTDMANLLAEQLVAKAIAYPAEEVSKAHRGCYVDVYVGDDFIAVTNGQRGRLDYYCGFDYVDKTLVTTVGDYTFYRYYAGADLPDEGTGETRVLELAQRAQEWQSLQV